MQALLNLTSYQYWDIAGVDGLQVAKSLFGEKVDRIAPFQSLETTLETCPCSVLRLCEGNFRVSLQADSAVFEQAIGQAQQGKRVWIKQFAWMGAIAICESLGSMQLPQIAVPKPPHRLQGLQMNCAVPARIDNTAILVWRHSVLEQPAYELHAAVKDLDILKAKLLLS